jgi:hypothetical protein
MSEVDHRRCWPVTRRPGLARRLNRRTGVLALALLASAACIIPPFVTAGFAQVPSAHEARDAASYTKAHDYTVRVNADRTAEIIDTRRIKVLGIAAVEEIAQQTVAYVEGLQSFEIVEAFTEKADGTRRPVDPATTVTRDAASGLNAVFMQGVRLVTVIFPDVAVGDTLVLTTRHSVHSDTFAGHLEQATPFDSDVAYDDSRMLVIAPSNLPLKVGVIGEGVQHTVTVEGSETRHLITVRGGPATPDEDRMTARLDRDPAVFFTTLADYEDLARSYWRVARGATAVTPEIGRLAGEITQGIEDRRAQARAISSWIRTNIRYVPVRLGWNRVEVHDAEVALKNRYGDAKDIAALASALLAAKGIATEHVLLNDDTAYTLPEPATMGYINDVILFLPEFGIYDDPAATFTSFGVLAVEEYDKPAVHVSDRGARLAHTPAMKPEDHLSIRRTRLTIAADGTVSGETEQSGTGVFATTMRSIATSLQTDGLKEAAEEYLRRADTPGKGAFEVGSLTERGNSYSVRAQFTLDERVSVKPAANFAVPPGLGVLARPGDYLLGTTRVPGRRAPFTCFAGTQVEEIDLAFADGVPLPVNIDGRRIETKSFVYTAGYRLEGRTLKIRREFVSRVPGQVCAPDVEAEIAAPLHEVAGSRATHVTLSGDTLELKRTAAVDQPLNVDFLSALNADCSPVGVAGVRTVEEPKHGRLTIEKGSGFLYFALDNPRHACNRQRIEGMHVRYQPEPGYLGPDAVTVDVLYGDGTSRKRHYAITVDPRPEPVEVSRAALTGQQVRVGFMVNLDPDCAPVPVASVRILEGPRHGDAILKADTGFANFAKDNPRFECNKQRVNGWAVLYRGEEGYTGKDSVILETILADGRESRTRIAIEVK